MGTESFTPLTEETVANLKPGDRIRHRTSLHTVETLRERKTGDAAIPLPGWWLVGPGGVCDRALASGDWALDVGVDDLLEEWRIHEGWQLTKADGQRLVDEIDRLREQNTGLGVRVQEGWSEMERLRDLCGKHDPTGADHVAEMWEHAQRADAAERQLGTHKTFAQRINDLSDNAAQLTQQSLAYGMTAALSDLADNLDPSEATDG